MATAKNSPIETARPVDPMTVMDTVYLPRPTGKEEDTLTVGLNGKNYLIKKGVAVRVPLPVAEIVRDREKAIDRQTDYIRWLLDRAEAAATALR